MEIESNNSQILDSVEKLKTGEFTYVENMKVNDERFGGTYTGMVLQEDQEFREGYGVMILDDGACYEGMWKMNEPDGRGVMTIPQFDENDNQIPDSQPTVKIGEFDGFKPIGFLLRTENDQTYVGYKTEDGKKEYAQIKFNNGDEYTGFFYKG